MITTTRFGVVFLLAVFLLSAPVESAIKDTMAINKCDFPVLLVSDAEISRV